MGTVRMLTWIGPNRFEGDGLGRATRWPWKPAYETPLRGVESATKAVKGNGTDAQFRQGQRGD